MISKQTNEKVTNAVSVLLVATDVVSVRVSAPGLANPTMPVYAYSASKAAVIHMTRHLAADLARENINVNGIAPGFFHSKMTAGLLDQFEEALLAKTPRGRMGTPEDMAGTAIYLSSRASAWVVGHTVVLDGGIIAAAG